jgi:hypothetical protein
MLLIAAICIIQPVLGVNGTVSIAYRGSGGSYIGDMIVFDGQNTVGNITFLRITGPGLPADGVPIYDLNGVPGAGNPVEVNPDGTWKFVWYSSTVKGIEKMQTARYNFIAADLTHPEFSSTASVFMKKAEFYANLSPNPATLADYVSLTGFVEQQGISYLQIDIKDISGKIFRTYTSPVASGYFNYGFHVDMPPGQYYITMSNPSIKNPLVMIFTVIPPRTPTPITTTGGVSSGKTTSSITSAATTQNPPVVLSPVIQKSPSSIPLSPVTALIGLLISGVIALYGKGRKNQ